MKKIFIFIVCLLALVNQVLALNTIAKITNNTGKELYIKSEKDTIYELEEEKDNPIMSNFKTTILYPGKKTDVYEASVVFSKKDKKGWFIGIDDFNKKIANGSNLYTCLSKPTCDEKSQKITLNANLLEVTSNISATYGINEKGLIILTINERE
ncbi:hypothetical protein [Francisella sp. SYW-2]|uniref:hypothetical protein n=1 Tax=Francisella sp. SYW-2 TaxID=2610886 RepID=UPI00123DA173|nr:hypothetical protein [Francisella sp. SYW-2]